MKIKDLVEGYEDNLEEGVVAYSGKLDVRPPYQREFVYKDDQRNAVIDSVSKKYPLNVMYWAVRDDNNFEIIDTKCQIIQVYFNAEVVFISESVEFNLAVSEIL